MEGIRNVLNTLRVQIEKETTRRKDAEAHTKILESKLEGKDVEVVALQDRLSLTRRLIVLADQWDEIRRKLQEAEERIGLAESRVERLGDVLQRVESETDTLETQYLDFRAKQRALETEMIEFLA